MSGEVLAELKQMLSEVLRDTDEQPRVEDDADIVHDLGLDSIQMVAFLLEVEQRFGLALDFENLDIAQLGSVRQFARFVEEQQGARATG